MRSQNRHVRLVKLEGLIGDIACDHCRHWTAIALVGDDGEPERPIVCPMCGRSVPVREKRQFVGVGIDVA